MLAGGRTALHHILTIQCQASECRCRRFATKVRDCVSRFSTGWPWGKGMKTKIAWMFRREKEKQKKGDNVWEKAERAHLFSIISISMAHWHLTEIRYTVVVFFFFWGPIILEFGKGSYNMQCWVCRQIKLTQNIIIIDRKSRHIVAVLRMVQGL